ncbi:Potassium channel SKOR [Hordeum vulgare]|nr:Potassium channel SKOR [Hordeum vulgare]
MVFIMVYVSFSMLLGAYLIGNMTALIVKGSRIKRFCDKMTELVRYMNRNQLGSDISSQVKAHPLLQYESSYKRDRIVDDIPTAVQSKYGGHALHRNDESNQEYCISLHLRLTDYRTFVGTNLSSLWEKIFVPSEGKG